jgi:hypothetical protein
MRRILLSGIVLFAGQQTGSAQAPGYGCQVPAGPGCQVPQYCYPYVCPPCERPSREERAPGPTYPEGAFVAGPQRGEVAGESQSMGLRFGTIRIPAITVPFPTVQLPSLVRYRRDAEMITEAAHLPYAHGEISRFELSPERAPADEEKAPAPPEFAPPAPAPAPCPYPCYPQQYHVPCVPGCTTGHYQPQQLDQLQQQMAQLQAAVVQLAALQQAQAQAPPTLRQESMAPANRVAESARQTQTQADLQRQQEQLHAEYEQKCRDLETMQAQMDELQHQYQSLLETKQSQLVMQREQQLRKRLEERTAADGPASQDSHVMTPAAPQPRSQPQSEPRSKPPQVESHSEEPFQGLSHLDRQYQWRQQPQPAAPAVQQVAGRQTSDAPGLASVGRQRVDTAERPTVHVETVRAQSGEEKDPSLLARWWKRRK